MHAAIPILPCAAIDAQCRFYEAIGFSIIQKYKSPNAYAVVAYNDLTLHFWGSKKHDPAANASMVFVITDDVDGLHRRFCENLKKAQGKISRTGMPRISKVRELKDDRRFTLCDPAGNTLYFGMPNDGSTVHARTLENEKHAKAFAAVYDLLHSHEEPKKAANALAIFMHNAGELEEPDKKKLENLASAIASAIQLEESLNDTE